MRPLGLPLFLLASGWLTAQTPQDFTVSPSFLDFGSVVAGHSATGQVRVQVVQADIPTVIFSIDSKQAEFSAAPATFQLRPGTFQDVTLTFSPKTVGMFSGVITVSGTRQGAPAPTQQTVSVSGNGVPVFTVSPASLNFGEVQVKSTAALSFNVIPALPVTFTLTSTNPAFTVNPSSFSAAQTTAVSVTFMPAVTGSFSGTIQITGTQSNGPQQTATVSLSGTGTTLFSVSPPSLNFGNVIIGAQSALSVTVSPKAQAAFTVTSTHPAFSASPANFAGATARAITVTFSPTDPGPVQAAIVVTGSTGPFSDPVTIQVGVSGVGTTGFTASPGSLDFGGVLLGCNASRTFTVTPAASMVFTVVSDSTAYVATPDAFEGSSARPVTVQFSPQTTGPASAKITIRASAGQEVVQTATVGASGTGADVAVTPSSVDFGLVPVGGQSVRTLMLAINPTITATFAVTAASGHPAFTAKAGSQPGQVEITFAPTAQGSFNTRITITLDRQDQGFVPCTVSRTVTVSGSGIPPAAITASPSVVEFFANTGAPLKEQRMVTITSKDLAELTWTAEVTGGAPAWLRITPAGGVPGNQVVEIDTSGLAAGAYEAQVVITARMGSAASAVARVLARATVTDAPAQLAVAPSALSFVAIEGSTAPVRRALLITNKGGGSLSWVAVVETLGNLNWLSVTPASLSSPASAAAVVNLSGLSRGVYQGKIRVRFGSQEVVVPVTLLVAPPGPILATDRYGVVLEAIEGTRQVSQRVRVLNIGSGIGNWAATLEQAPDLPSALSLDNASGSSDADTRRAPPTITITATIPGAVPDTSRPTSGAFFLRNTNTPGAAPDVVVPAILNVLRAGSPPPLELSTGGLVFVGPAGGSAPAPQEIEVQIASPQQVALRAAVTTFSGGNWLTVSPSSGSAGAGQASRYRVSATVNRPSGVYRGQVSFALADGLVRSVNVTLVVTPGGAASAAPSVIGTPVQQNVCSPASLVATGRMTGNFSARAGWPTLVEVQVNDNCGATVDTASVVATFSNGDPPLPLASVGGGLYDGTWVAVRAAEQVNVRATAIAPGLSEAEAVVVGTVSENAYPRISKGGIVNGASFAAGAPLPPGGIISAFGANFATGNSQAGAVPLPVQLGGVTLVVGGRQAPLYFTGPSQINAQMPFEIEPAKLTQATARVGTLYAVPETITTIEAQPGIFILPASIAGPDHAAAQNQDFSTNTPSNAVPRGGVVIVYLTGQGAVSPAVATGAGAPTAEPLARATLSAEATIGGQRAEILFLGLAPSFVGLLQAALLVPNDAPTGAAVPITVSIAGQPSNTLMISVK